MDKLALLILSLLISVSVFAMDEEEELPKSGTIASASSGLGTGDREIDGPWGGINIQSEDPNPLTGSVRRVSDNEFEYTVKNKSEDKYSARIKLVQMGKNQKVIKSTLASVNLAAGDSVTRSLRVGPTVTSVDLRLENWKATKKKKSEEELQAEIDAKQQELKALQAGQ